MNKNTNIPEDKREAIINASIDEFAKHEYKHAILENIANNANISKSLLLYHFQNKKNLYLYVYEYVYEYIEKVKKISDFPLLFKAAKPDTKHVKEFLNTYNINISDCVLVGDRPLTDVLCGKRLGCKTILVDSITADTETKLVRFVRKLERLSIRH